MEGCGRFEAFALPLTLSTFALRCKPHWMAVMRQPDQESGSRCHGSVGRDHPLGRVCRSPVPDHQDLISPFRKQEKSHALFDLESMVALDDLRNSPIIPEIVNTRASSVRMNPASVNQANLPLCFRK